MSFRVARTHRPLRVTCEDRDFEIEIFDDRVIIDGIETDWSAVEIDRSIVSLLMGGYSYEVHIERDGPDSYAVTINQSTRRVKVHSDFSRHSGGADLKDGPSGLTAPMPGMVRQVMVNPGDAVEAGQGLVVLEAMKMENELRAAGPSRVRAVHVESGQAITRGTLLIEFDP